MALLRSFLYFWIIWSWQFSDKHTIIVAADGNIHPAQCTRSHTQLKLARGLFPGRPMCKYLPRFKAWTKTMPFNPSSAWPISSLVRWAESSCSFLTSCLTRQVRSMASATSSPETTNGHPNPIRSLAQPLKCSGLVDAESQWCGEQNVATPMRRENRWHTNQNSKKDAEELPQSRTVDRITHQDDVRT